MHVAPLFQMVGGDICYMSPTFFSLVFVFGEVSKTKVTFVCHVLCEELFMLDVTHNQVNDETEFGETK